MNICDLVKNNNFIKIIAEKKLLSIFLGSSTSDMLDLFLFTFYPRTRGFTFLTATAKYEYKPDIQTVHSASPIGTGPDPEMLSPGGH